MKIHDQSAYRTADELEIIRQRLPVQGARVLELGCGGAWMTRRIAEQFHPAELIATEVDRIQHARNLQIDDLPGVRFLYGGAQSIDLPDESMDLVLMLKSLHHVPLDLMGRGLREIHRVLRPGGLAYISEPVYHGEFNDIMRLFHDEKRVRAVAFEKVRDAVQSGLFELVEQIFFNAPGHFRDFQDFERRMIKVTHTAHHIDQALLRRIKESFERHMTDQGADFLKPSRVDLLRRPTLA